MGKRKSSSKPQGPRKKEGLETIFTCLFCNHEKSVNVKLDKKAGVGSLECKICNQRYQCPINYLSAPVDVYSDWVDAADAVAEERRELAKSGNSSNVPADLGRRDMNEVDAQYDGESMVPDGEYD